MRHDSIAQVIFEPCARMLLVRKALFRDANTALGTQSGVVCLSEILS